MKYCKAINKKNGKRCKFEQRINGYCTRHFEFLDGLNNEKIDCKKRNKNFI